MRTRPTPTNRPWLVLVGCFLVATGFNAYLFAPASIMQPLVEAFDIDKATAGLSISVVFLAWVLLQLPSGFLLDRYDNRKLVWAGVLIFLAAALGGLVTPNYPAFLATRFIAGTTAVFLWTANANIVGQSFPPARRALGTSLFVASAPAGVTIAQAIGPPLEAAIGWRGTVAAYGLVTVTGLPLFVWALDAPVQNESALSLSKFASALGNRQVLAIAVSSFCAYSLFVFFNSWMPTYATDVIGVTKGTAGTLTALLPAMGLLARPGGGWLSDRIGRRRRPVIFFAFAMVIPALVIASVATSVLVFVVALVLAGIGSQLGTGVFYVYVDEMSPPESGGTSLAVLLTLSMAGSLVAPVATGWLIDAVSWTAAFGFGGIVALGGILAIIGLPEP